NFGHSRDRRLLPSARRRAGIIRRLLRKIELGFEFGHPRAQRRVFGLHRRQPRAKLLDAREQRLDQRVFFGLVETIKRRWDHTLLDSYSPRLRQTQSTE